MTCIVGMTDGRRVYLGGDSLGANSAFHCATRLDEKVFANGQFVIGYTTSFRMGQILRYAFEPPPVNTWDVRRYMATTFVDAMRHAFTKAGFLAKGSDGQESGGNFLVGYRGQLFEIHSDHQVAVPADGYTACGCGSQIALGAMFAAASMAPLDRLKLALLASSNFSAGVRGPFHFVSTEEAPR